MELFLGGLVFAGLLVGFGVTVWFLSVHRPQQVFSSAYLNTAGWVIIIGLLYLRAILIYLLPTPELPSFEGFDAFVSLGFLLAIDVLLVWRLRSFLKYRKAYLRFKNEDKLKLNGEGQIVVDDN